MRINEIPSRRAFILAFLVAPGAAVSAIAACTPRRPDQVRRGEATNNWPEYVIPADGKVFEVPNVENRQSVPIGLKQVKVINVPRVPAVAVGCLWNPGDVKIQTDTLLLKGFMEFQEVGDHFVLRNDPIFFADISLSEKAQLLQRSESILKADDSRFGSLRESTIALLRKPDIDSTLVIGHEFVVYRGKPNPLSYIKARFHFAQSPQLTT